LDPTTSNFVLYGIFLTFNRSIVTELKYAYCLIESIDMNQSMFDVSVSQTQ